MTNISDAREQTSETNGAGARAPANANITPDLFAGTQDAAPIPGPAAVVPGKAEPKRPSTAPLVQTVPIISPPPASRAHESRPIAVRPPAFANGVPPGKEAAAAKETRRSRFPLLAATMAVAAAVGGAAGAVGTPALINLAFGPATAQPVHEAAADSDAIKELLNRLTHDVGTLRLALEQSGKLTAVQFGKVTERLDRAERAQAEPVAKLAKIGETVERLERRVPAPPAAPEVTGSIAQAHPPAPPPEKPKPTIIDDYVVRKVFDGVALVEGRRGIMEVEPGSTLPGAGRVEEIRRQDGRWVVVTNKGLIVPAR
jgi:hypothetical protein